MEENKYQFDLPTHHKSIIKVIGVGGGGSNAVNHMYNLGIKDVEFVICNTDSQALESSPVKNKLQIGMNLTEGLGAGANPEKGKNAALESKEEIRDLLSEDTKMIFITAGMGGGTGTGAAPVMAQVAQELDILTVGIVTAPFAFEGKKKTQAANEGINQMRQYCDTVLVIMNDKLREVFGNLPISDAFAQADNVLNTAAKGIAEIITVPGYVNVDFEDVKTVMKNAGRAVMGSAKTHGENRARRAAEEALNSPLLNDQEVFGAERILLSIMSGSEAELQMDELTEITDYIEEFAGEDADVIFGHGIDPSLEEHIRVTVIATGYSPDVPTEDVAKEPYLKTVDTDIVEAEPETDSKVDTLETDEPIVFDLDLPEIANVEIIPQSPGITEDPHLQPSLFEKPEEEEEKTYEFDFIKAEIQKEIEDEEDRQKEGLDFDFEIEGDFELEGIRSAAEEEEAEDQEIDELIDGSAIPISKKVQLMEERKRREEELNGQKVEMRTEDFKEKLDVPAYERKKVALKDVPHSSERNISKFNLTDDNQILGNNKFLHDNVD
ncbi:MAG: cell division protein FtsZ [Cytophagales bacterium]|nr:cell division protein FtsZ [Cytophagales bacterium]